MIVYDTEGESRELYDLCRLYKFKYKELQQKEEVNNKYGNKWSGDLVSEARKELREVEEDMLGILIEKMCLHEWKGISFHDKDVVLIYSQKFRNKMCNIVEKVYGKN